MTLIGLVLPLVASCSTLPRQDAVSGMSCVVTGTASYRERIALPPALVQLEGTYWRLTHLGGQPVPIAPQQREPHLILDPQSRRVSGSGGCNRLFGGYELEGERLVFGQLATTRMACLDGMETEAAFLSALGTVRTWRIAGPHLDLFDDRGGLVARFEARP